MSHSQCAKGECKYRSNIKAHTVVIYPLSNFSIHLYSCSLTITPHLSRSVSIHLLNPSIHQTSIYLLLHYIATHTYYAHLHTYICSYSSIQTFHLFHLSIHPLSFHSLIYPFTYIHLPQHPYIYPYLDTYVHTYTHPDIHLSIYSSTKPPIHK